MPRKKKRRRRKKSENSMYLWQFAFWKNTIVDTEQMEDFLERGSRRQRSEILATLLHYKKDEEFEMDSLEEWVEKFEDSLR